MNLRVLIVDDEPLIAEHLTAFLEDEGIEVRTARSAEDALRLIAADPDFDACVMDVRLPGMSGDAAIRAMHRLRPGLRFIIQTGSADYSIPDDLRVMGVLHAQLFKKPLSDMGLLSSALREVVRH